MHHAVLLLIVTALSGTGTQEGRTGGTPRSPDSLATSAAIRQVLDCARQEASLQGYVVERDWTTRLDLIRNSTERSGESEPRLHVRAWRDDSLVRAHAYAGYGREVTPPSEALTERPITSTAIPGDFPSWVRTLTARIGQRCTAHL